MLLKKITLFKILKEVCKLKKNDLLKLNGKKKYTYQIFLKS